VGVESSDRSLSQTAPWGELLRDAQQRVSIVDRIVSQMGNDDIPMVDRAVVAILHHVGLPRGPQVRGPIVEPVGHGWAGRKAPDCRLLIDTDEFHDLHGVIRADSLLKTWFHESIHGRQPFAPGSAEEWRLHRGFEEGLAEGLARSLSQELGLQPSARSRVGDPGRGAVAPPVEIPCWHSCNGLHARSRGHARSPRT
jgi:hypothetical protein